MLRTIHADGEGSPTAYNGRTAVHAPFLPATFARDHTPTWSYLAHIRHTSIATAAATVQQHWRYCCASVHILLYRRTQHHSTELDKNHNKFLFLQRIFAWWVLRTAVTSTPLLLDHARRYVLYWYSSTVLLCSGMVRAVSIPFTHTEKKLVHSSPPPPP